MVTRADVIVVGTGPSGLASAQSLSQMGFSVICLEARKIAGGRVCSLPLRIGYPIELGAELVVGERSCLRTAFTSLKVVTNTTVDKARYQSGPTEAPEPIKNNFYKRLEKAYVDLASTEDVADEACDAWLRRAGLTDEQLQLAEAYIGVVMSTTLPAMGTAESQVQTVSSYFGDGEQQFRPELPISTIIQALRQRLDIRLGHLVTHVEVSDGKVRVECEGGLRFEGRAAVVAVPLKMLQNDTIRFDPPLEPPRTEAIHRVQVGSAMKTIVFLDRPIFDGAMSVTAPNGPIPLFWFNPQEDKARPQLLPTKDLRSEGSHGLQGGADRVFGTDEEQDAVARLQVGGIEVFGADLQRISGETELWEWVRGVEACAATAAGVNGYSQLPPRSMEGKGEHAASTGGVASKLRGLGIGGRDVGSPTSGSIGVWTAVGFTSGEYLKAVRAQGDSSAHVEVCVQQLEGIAQRSLREHVLGVLQVDWDQAPHVASAYTFPTLGAKPITDHVTLSEPHQEAVVFAGEACHPGVNNCVQSAMETGFYAAHNIALRLGPLGEEATWAKGQQKELAAALAQLAKLWCDGVTGSGRQRAANAVTKLVFKEVADGMHARPA